MVKGLLIINTVEKNIIVRSEEGKKGKKCEAVHYNRYKKKRARKDLLKRLCNNKTFPI